MTTKSDSKEPVDLSQTPLALALKGINVKRVFTIHTEDDLRESIRYLHSKPISRAVAEAEAAQKSASKTATQGEVKENELDDKS